MHPAQGAPGPSQKSDLEAGRRLGPLSSRGERPARAVAVLTLSPPVPTSSSILSHSLRFPSLPLSLSLSLNYLRMSGYNMEGNKKRGLSPADKRKAMAKAKEEILSGNK